MDAQKRRYQPIWEQLKANKSISVSSPKEYHRRLIKAVKKEKDIDKSYKLACKFNAKKSRLSYKIAGSKVTFCLNETIGLDDL